MQAFSAHWFDGQTARAHPVEVSFVNHALLRVRGADIDFSVALDTVKLAPPVGNAVGVIQLGEGGELHTRDARALAALATLHRPARPERLAARLESRLPYAVAALLVAVTVVFVGLRWGVPLAAERVAASLPPGIERSLGENSLQTLDKLVFAPSTLPPAQKTRFNSRLASLCQQTRCPSWQLVFRDGKRVGPNAFALPGNTLVVTDQLARMAKHDDELIAVLAHELGHVEAQHGVRLALQSIGAGVLLIAVTGDLGSVTDLAAGLPSILLQAGYSRDMEREADTYALAWLQSVCIPPQRYVAILERLSAREVNANTSGDKPGRTPTSPPRSQDTDARAGMFDSHPGVNERLQAFRDAPTCR